MKLICQTCGKNFEYHRKRKSCINCVPPKTVYASEEERYEARKRQLVKNTQNRRDKVKEMAIKYKGDKCQLCGYNKCKGALEFHHLDPKEKDFAIGNKGYTRAWETVKQELDKCIMVCANCHREIHNDLIDLDI